MLSSRSHLKPCNPNLFIPNPVEDETRRNAITLNVTNLVGVDLNSFFCASNNEVLIVTDHTTQTKLI